MENTVVNSCDHSGSKILSDPFLSGMGLDHKHPHQVQWCSSCGAARVVFGNPNLSDEPLRYGDWWIPESLYDKNKL